MNTFAAALIDSLDDRWDEINVLLQKAEAEKDNEQLFNALCRSAIVLLVGHFEGFIKDAVKAAINDINHNSSFKNIPIELKRTFCSYFIDKTEHGNEYRINLLIDTFDNLETKLKVEPFLNDTPDNNKNPAPAIVEKIARKFGVSNFFQQLHESDLDVIFEDDKNESDLLLQRLRDHLEQGISDYPYNLDSNSFGVKEKTIKGGKKTRTLWESFLDELLRTRHAIAHGTSLDNGRSVPEIELNVAKIKILQCIFSIVLFETIATKSLSRVC